MPPLPKQLLYYNLHFECTLQLLATLDQRQTDAATVVVVVVATTALGTLPSTPLPSRPCSKWPSLPIRSTAASRPRRTAALRRAPLQYLLPRRPKLTQRPPAVQHWPTTPTHSIVTWAHCTAAPPAITAQCPSALVIRLL